jgi:PIN domain nuclease of toxin-antitoxin system
MVYETTITASEFISPISAWEIGLSSRLGRPNPVHFLPDPKTWFARLLAVLTIRQAAFAPDITIDSADLPLPLHGIRPIVY